MMDNVESGGLLPRFTLRWFSIYFTLAIFGAWILRQALMGSLWAWAAVFTLAALAGFFAFYALLFLVIWIPSRLAQSGRSSNQSLVTDTDNGDTGAGA